MLDCISGFCQYTYRIPGKKYSRPLAKCFYAAGLVYQGTGSMAPVDFLTDGLALSRAAELPAARAWRWLAAVTAAALGFALLLPGALRWLGSPALDAATLPGLLHGLLLLVAGLITGSLFPVAAGALLAGRHGVRAAASGLEAADHAGAAVAALLGGVIFIPALGLTGTAWLVVALEIAALVGVGLALPRREEAGTGT